MSVSASVSVPMKKMKLMQCHKQTPTINITHMLCVQNACGNSLQIILKKKGILLTLMWLSTVYLKKKIPQRDELSNNQAIYKIRHKYITYSVHKSQNTCQIGLLRPTEVFFCFF